MDMRKRDRNILTVPLTDEQAELLETARHLPNGAVIPKADFARFAIFSLYIPRLGHVDETASPDFPRPVAADRAQRPSHSERVARRRERQSPPSTGLTELQWHATEEDRSRVPGKVRVESKPVPEKKIGGEPPVPKVGERLDVPVDDVVVQVQHDPDHHLSRSRSNSGAGADLLTEFRANLDQALRRNR